MGNHEVKYRGTTARARWRALYLKAEITSPEHKASQRWLAAAASELFDVAEVSIKPGGVITADPLANPEEEVTLELSREAVLGIKFAIVAALTGRGGKHPSPGLERKDLLAAALGIGPDGKLCRLIEAEAKLPERDGGEAEDRLLEGLEEKA